MTVALRPPRMTEAEFLAWAEPLDERWEFDGIGPVAMVGNTEAHAIIQANLLRVLGNLLRGTPCRPVGSNLRLRAGASFRLPDAQVFCRAAVPARRIVTDPVVVFEILSENTAGTDRLVKVNEYWRVASLRYYVIVEQGQIGASVLTRGVAHWELESVLAGGTMSLLAIGIALPIDELYEGLDRA